MRRAGGGSKSRWPAMLVVRGVILAEWSNSGAGSGLLWKIEIGEKKDIQGGSLAGDGGGDILFGESFDRRRS